MWNGERGGGHASRRAAAARTGLSDEIGRAAFLRRLQQNSLWEPVLCGDSGAYIDLAWNFGALEARLAELQARMAEVQQLNLIARLVVLSECDSFRGELRTDGVVGITRAFVAGGALALVASLWKIDDDATCHFMQLFYRALLCLKLL